MSLATTDEYLAHHLIASQPKGTAYTTPELQAFLDDASAWFESQCMQPIAQANEIYPEQVGTVYASVDAQGVLNLFPRFFPVIDINSIKYRYDPSEAWSSASAFATTDYTVQDYAHSGFSWGAIIRIPSANPFVRGQWGEVELDIDVGYPTDAIPGDIKEAVILKAFEFAAARWAPVDPETNRPLSIIPAWVEGTKASPGFIPQTVDKYQRRF